MAKPKDYDEALVQLTAAKEDLAEKREDLRNFKTENKIKRNKPVEDEAIKKQLETKEAGVEKAREAVDAAKLAAKELKPRKERVTKYEYPDDCTTDKDKKRYRAKMRREAKKEAAGETEGKDKKPAKKVVKKDAKTED